MPTLRANIPKARQGLLSPGLKKFGKNVGKLAREYIGGMSDTVSLPGRIYKGTAKPTMGNTLGFALNIAGGGFSGGMVGRGGLGMGGRRLARGTNKAIPDEELVLKRLRDTAKGQYKINRSKYIQNKMNDLQKQFQDQVIGYERVSKKARPSADKALTKTAGEISKYRKMLSDIKGDLI